MRIFFGCVTCAKNLRYQKMLPPYLTHENKKMQKIKRFYANLIFSFFTFILFSRAAIRNHFSFIGGKESGFLKLKQMEAGPT